MQSSERTDLEHWWKEHSDIDVLVGQLVHALDRRSASAASEAAAELAEAIAAHMAVEEDVYFPLVSALAPRARRALDRIRIAHLRVREGLDAIQRWLAEGDLDAAHADLVELLIRFRSHERDEARLIGQLDDIRTRASGRPDRATRRLRRAEPL